MKKKKWISIILAIIIAVVSTYFIIKTYGATGIANTKNEEALVRMAAAKAMAQNSDRSVTRDQVATMMANYIASSKITVTDYTEKVTVKYNDTGNTYTVWKGKTYTVKYNANGGSGAPASQTKLKGTNLTLSSTKPTRTNYTFLGWGTSSSDTTVNYAAGATYSTDANITLYAIWDKNQYYIINTASTPDYGSETFNSWTENTDTGTAGWVSGTATTNGNITCSISSRSSTGGVTIYGNDSTVGYNAALVKSKKTVPSSEYKTMYITYRVNTALTGKTLYCGLSSNSGTTGHNTYNTTQTGATYKTLSVSQTTSTTVSLDISSVTTDQYFYAYMHNPVETNEGYLYITAVWFE